MRGRKGRGSLERLSASSAGTSHRHYKDGSSFLSLFSRVARRTEKEKARSDRILSSDHCSDGPPPPPAAGCQIRGHRFCPPAAALNPVTGFSGRWWCDHWPKSRSAQMDAGRGAAARRRCRGARERALRKKGPEGEEAPLNNSRSESRHSVEPPRWCRVSRHPTAPNLPSDDRLLDAHCPCTVALGPLFGDGKQNALGRGNGSVMAAANCAPFWLLPSRLERRWRCLSQRSFVAAAAPLGLSSASRDGGK